MSPHAPASLAPTRIDPVAASASEIIGGPLGRHTGPLRRAARSAWQPAASVLVGLSSLTVALGFLQKGHCFTEGWNNPDQFWHACYTDLPVSSGLGHAMPYLSGSPHLDQPLVSGVVMWLVGLVVPDGSVRMQQQWYFALWAVLITVIVMALVLVTAASVPRAPWRAAHVALSPVLVLVGLISVDLLGVLLASIALWAWGRNKLYLAGIFMGLAISARSYPLVLLVAIGLLGVRSGRLRAWARFAGTALVTLVVVSLPFLVVNMGGLLSVYRTWWRGTPSYGSLWMVSGLLGHGLASRLNLLVLLGWLAALVVGALFTFSMDRRPAVAEVSLVMLVIVVLTGKAIPPQAGIWLLPLIALVALTWRDHLIWAGFEATYFVSVWLYIAGLTPPGRGMPSALYAVFTLLRVVAWVYLLVQVWRTAWSRPPASSSELVEQEPAEPELDGQDLDGQDLVEPDLVEPDLVEPDLVEPELDGQDLDGQESVDLALVEEVDPLAGPMAGAPDQVIVRIS
ncbi:MAG: glycosyltransferase 87 family protein [Actinomycetota bacterium]